MQKIDKDGTLIGIIIDSFLGFYKEELQAPLEFYTTEYLLDPAHSDQDELINYENSLMYIKLVSYDEKKENILKEVCLKEILIQDAELEFDDDFTMTQDDDDDFLPSEKHYQEFLKSDNLAEILGKNEFLKEYLVIHFRHIDENDLYWLPKDKKKEIIFKLNSSFEMKVADFKNQENEIKNFISYIKGEKVEPQLNEESHFEAVTQSQVEAASFLNLESLKALKESLKGEESKFEMVNTELCRTDKDGWDYSIFLEDCRSIREQAKEEDKEDDVKDVYLKWDVMVGEVMRIAENLENLTSDKVGEKGEERVIEGFETVLEVKFKDCYEKEHILGLVGQKA